MIVFEIIGYIIAGLMFFYAAFAVTKKLFKKRTLSYLLSGAFVAVWFSIMLFQKNVEISKIGVIICILLDIIITLAFYIGEKRALSSGKHCGDFEKDRGARKFAPYSIKKCMKKFKYPFLKDKGIFNNLEFEPANRFVDTDSAEYRQEVLSKKMTGHFIHWFFIFFWYMMVLGIWIYYFMGYGVYWMVVAAIDTFKELFTEQGSKFSFKSAISEIANSEELANGVSAIKSAVSEVGNTVSGISQKASSAISEHRKEKQDIQENQSTDIQSENVSEVSAQEFQSENAVEISSDTNNIVPDFENTVSDDDIQSIANYTEEDIAGSIIAEIQKTSSDLNMQNDSTNQQTKTATSSAPVHSYEPRPAPMNIAPAQNAQPENVPPPAPTATPQYNQGYAVQQQKTNTAVIAVIIILVLVIGILGGMLFMMNRDKPAVPESSSFTDESYSVDEIIETTQETAEIESNSQSNVSMVEVDSFYLDAISQSLYKAVSSALTVMDEEGYNLKGYYIVSSDEKYNYNIPDYFDVNAFISESINFYESLNDYNWFVLINDGDCIYAQSWTDENTFGYYRNSRFLEAKLNKEDANTVSDVFENAKTEENAIKDYIKSKNEPVTEPLTEPPTQKPTEKQSDTISYYTSSRYGIINTKNDPLNLRSAPDANADIIYKVPIGAGVELLGETDKWYYARFGIMDVAGIDSYEGYLSKEFVMTTSARIISLVPKNGQINCHGVEVAGFTTNYIALGEKVSLIRKSLGDGWHITAKNMCENYGVTWYELWDSEDGDYYGWVDANYVDLDL